MTFRERGKSQAHLRQCRPCPERALGILAAAGLVAWAVAVFPRAALVSLDEAPAAARERPIPFTGRGRLVCLPEAMRDAFGADVPPVHEHVLGLRLEEPPAAGAGGAGAAGAAGAGAETPFLYLSLLRNGHSEALFVDERFRGRELRLYGRLFPRTAILEVSRFQWRRDGKLVDVYYWCEVCSIRGVDPGPCACCQGAVELREAPAAAPSEGGA